MNAFVKETTMGAGSSYTENGALSYATAGSALIDQFGKAGTARGREMSDVWNEQATLWAENPELALRFPFYLRLITRKTNLLGESTEISKVQRGQGARDESFKRLLWIERYHPDEFYRNLWLVPVVGSWKDLWVLMTMGVGLRIGEFYKVIAAGINDDNHRDLVKKYLPRIRSKAKCHTEWAKKTNELAMGFAKFAGWSFKDYREFKSTGKAHEFQRIICSKMYDNIEWNKIPGKALLNLVTGKFLKVHDLESAYVDWLKNQPVAKFNGYPFELGDKVVKAGFTGLSLAQKMTVDKQFLGLLETGKSDGGAIKGNVLCALDTSGSMDLEIGGANGITPFDVCISLGIYFSALNEGCFHNVVAMFDDNSWIKQLKGDSFTDKLWDIRRDTTAWGSTNFQSLIDLICDTRRNHPEIPLEDFPQTLLVVSDMQFNPTDGTNYEAMMHKLSFHFPSEWVDNFKVVWWFCANRDGIVDVPATMDKKGMYLVSGFDGSIVSLILGGEEKVNEVTGKKEAKSMEEAVIEALSQEVLQFVH